MENYRHLLVALDISNDARLVLQRALDIARHYDAKLSLIHVVEPMLIEHSYDLISALPAELDEKLVDRAKQFLDKITDEPGMPDMQKYVETGSIKNEIFRVVAEQQVDLIVIGSHGRHGVGLLLGSTATSVLHGTPCDVFAIRLPD